MTRPVTYVTTQKGPVSGQSIYEDCLTSAVAELMPVRVLTVGGCRSDASVRLPHRVQRALPHALRRRLGQLSYRGDGLVHRLDLGAPPSPREVLTVHDLAPLHFPDEGRLPRDAIASMRSALAVLTASHSSAAEIKALSGRHDVVVIPHGVDPAVLTTPAASDSQLEALGIEEPFVLCAGGTSARKNLVGLRAGWDEVAAAHSSAQLVLTGTATPRKQALFEGAKRVRLVGELPRDRFIGLLGRASVVVVPSVYEGFGLPVVEGLAVGAAVVAARRSSLIEVSTAGATLVEPSPLGLAEGILHALSTTQVATSPGERTPVTDVVTWSNVARRHVDLYASLA